MLRIGWPPTVIFPALQVQVYASSCLYRRRRVQCSHLGPSAPPKSRPPPGTVEVYGVPAPPVQPKTSLYCSDSWLHLWLHITHTTTRLCGGQPSYDIVARLKDSYFRSSWFQLKVGGPTFFLAKNMFIQKFELIRYRHF